MGLLNHHVPIRQYNGWLMGKMNVDNDVAMLSYSKKHFYNIQTLLYAYT